MKFYIYLAGASKTDAALLMPCGGYQFIYDGTLNLHVLDGGPLSLERFNEAGADLARRWPSGTRFRAIPFVQPEPEEAPAGWAKEREALLASVASKEQLIADMAAARKRKTATAEQTAG